MPESRCRCRLPIELHAGFDGRLLLYSARLLVLTTMFCCAGAGAPGDAAVAGAGAEAGRAALRSPRWTLRGVLVIGQVAVALVLLLTALLFLRNLSRAAGAESRIRHRPGRWSRRLSFVEGRYTRETRAAFLETAVERLKALPASSRPHTREACR